MPGPTGLTPFQEEFPRRFFDVGIAEQHAIASAAGLALGGMHPVVAVYATFLNRAFDQLLMDVGLLNLPVTVILDRAGVTGSDGASHNGVWDYAITGMVPGIHVAAPRDGDQLKALFHEAIAMDTPTVVRFPKGTLPPVIPAVETLDDGVDIIRYTDASADEDNVPVVLIVAIGAFIGQALAVADALSEAGAVSYTHLTLPTTPYV